MPYISVGEPTNPTKADFDGVNFDYEYPYGLDLDPKSEFHEFLRTRIWQRARESRLQISKRFDTWNEVDRTLTAYIPTDDKEKKIKNKDTRKPVSIVFPYTYSILESLLTYMTLAFFQDPMFQYEGVEDSDTIGAMLMEMVVRLDCIKTKVPLNIHTSIRDSLAYGIGVAIPGWEVKHGKVPVRSKVVTESALGSQEENSVEFVDSKIFEGNKLTNIDPYMWLPDPSVSSNNIQDGEYVGWIDRQNNYMNMLSEEANPESGVFNVKYLEKVRNRRSSLALDQSDREKKIGGPNDYRRRLTDSTNPVDNINMYINLIPKEWKLTDGEYPEKWIFRLSADDVITECYRADHNHGLYPR